MDGWTLNIMGVDPLEVKGRSAVQIALGAVASVLVHEAGHYAVGMIEGKHPRMDGTNVLIDGKPSQAFLGAGFAAQAVGSGLLTIVNKDSDFTYGFTAAGAAQAINYGIFRGGEYSDVKQLDHGDAVAWGSAAYQLILNQVNRRCSCRPVGSSLTRPAASSCAGSARAAT